MKNKSFSSICFIAGFQLVIIKDKLEEMLILRDTNVFTSSKMYCEYF